MEKRTSWHQPPLTVYGQWPLSGHFRPVPTAPVPPARLGARYGFHLEVPQESGLTWPFSTICARAGSCREGGLSSTDERVRGHVTEVTQALRKSS